jgi:hypothetical protein
VVKFKYRGPNTDQPAVSVDCKPMKSKDKTRDCQGRHNTRTSKTVAGISDKWLYIDESYASLYNVGTR